MKMTFNIEPSDNPCW